MGDTFDADSLSDFNGLEVQDHNGLSPQRSSVESNDRAILRRLAESITAKVMPPQELDKVRTSFDKRADERVRFTMRNGRKRLPGINEAAPVPDIAIYYVPGADLPQVNQLEEMELNGRPPLQKNKLWLANTAATLLQDFYVNTDFSIDETDRTGEVIRRIDERNRGIRKTSVDPLAIAKKSDLDITIDSDKVKIVNGVPDPSMFDIHSTAIEVDGSSLLRLMVGYRALINKDGPAVIMYAEQITELLETMIEDARRLFVRSPALARMSTRLRIINSEDTRYGFDDGSMFRTWTTSKGISEMISRGASYYNSLQTFGDEVQLQIRSKFLQMVVLLLSFLNRKDLEESKISLEETYGFKADPVDMEVTFLKILPLVSIAPAMFLEGAMSAFELKKMNLPERTEKGCSYAWDVLIQRITQRGYFVAAPRDYLGRESSSWLPDCKKFKDSNIFNNIQSFDRNHAINDIPTLQNHNDIPKGHRISAIFNDGRTYTATSQEIEKMTHIIKGYYTVTDSSTGETFDCVIEEELLNQEIFEAVTSINEVISAVNTHFSRSSNDWASNFSRAPREETWYKDVKSNGKLTKLVCKLRNEDISVTYKQEGKKISKEDLNRFMNADLREVEGVISSLDSKLKDYQSRTRGRGLGEDAKKRIRELKDALSSIRKKIHDGEISRRTILESQTDFSDEPMKQVLYPTKDTRNPSALWMDHHFTLGDDSSLKIDAKRFTVSKCHWDKAGQVDIRFGSTTGLPRALAVPLIPVKESEQAKLIQEGDPVVIAGRMLIVLEEDEDGRNIVVDCLHLLDFEKAEETTRRRRRANFDSSVVTVLA